jgi:hypothetical protein
VHLPQTKFQNLFPRLEKPFLFVHTPKCGGRFVERGFTRRRRSCVTQTNPSLKGHLTYLEYRDGMAALGLSIANYATFGLVRNPFAWHFSWYNYIRQDATGQRSGMPDEAALFQRLSFDDYLDWLQDPAPTSTEQRYYLRQVSDWVVDETGKIVVDDLLRQETLKDDLVAFRSKYNLIFKIPEKRINQSTHDDYRTAFSPRGVDIITQRHAHDLRFLGYTFES